MLSAVKYKIRITYHETNGKVTSVDVTLIKIGGGVPVKYDNVGKYGEKIPQVKLDATKWKSYKYDKTRRFYTTEWIEVELKDYRWMDIAINGILA